MSLLTFCASSVAETKQIQAFIRQDIDAFAIGLLMLFIGLSAIVFQFLRTKFKDWSLFWFGVFTFLYGCRLLANRGSVQLLLGVSDHSQQFLTSLISYLIIIPGLLFLKELYGEGWRSWVHWQLWFFSSYACIAIVTGALNGGKFVFPDPVNFLFFLVPAFLTLDKIRGYRAQKIVGSRVLVNGALIFMLFVVNEHLVKARLAPWRWTEEYLGFFIFICCLGYVAARRVIANEQQLFAIEQEMETAKLIQTSILPRKLPELRGIEVSVRYLPMTAVAGDFYDFLLVDEKRLGILVADVSGHGVPAALIASMVKVAFKSQAPNADDPARVINALNKILCSELEGHFVTAGYVFLNLETMTALYSGAGHPPLLLARKLTKEVEEIQENGLFLGFLPSENYSSRALALKPGDRLIMYTDGIIDTENPSEEHFGMDRFKELISENSQLPAIGFADSFLQHLSNWSGKKSGGIQTDDLTLIVVDVFGSEVKR